MDAPHGRWLNRWRKSLTATTQECCKQFWKSPGGNTPQSTSSTPNYLPSRKLSKLEEPDMQDTAGEAGTISQVMFYYGPLHMAQQAYIQQLCEDTGCSPEDLPEAMNNSEEKRKKIRDIRASGMTWWWWYMHIYIYSILSPSSCRATSTYFHVSLS